MQISQLIVNEGSSTFLRVTLIAPVSPPSDCPVVMSNLGFVAWRAMDEEGIGEEEMRPSFVPSERGRRRVTAHLDGSINQPDHNMYVRMHLSPPLFLSLSLFGRFVFRLEAL